MAPRTAKPVQLNSPPPAARSIMMMAERTKPPTRMAYGPHLGRRPCVSGLIISGAVWFWAGFCSVEVISWLLRIPCGGSRSIVRGSSRGG
ncbi:hypothetical protein ACFPRL_26140 [Pseudoclavibacter helvolus]